MKKPLLKYLFLPTIGCAPAPGAYNPKLDNHILGSVVYNKENSKSCPVSPTFSVSNLNSTRSPTIVSTFRTPTLPRRRKRAITPSSETTLVPVFTATDETSEDLGEKLVEKHINEKQLQKKLTTLQESLNINETEMYRVFKESEIKITEKETKCCNLEDELFTLREQFHNLESKYEEAINKQDEIRETYNAELDLVKNQSTSKIADMEKDVLKIVAQWEKTVSHLENEHKKSQEEMKMRFDFEKEEMRKDFENNIFESNAISIVMRQELIDLKSEYEEMHQKQTIENTKKEENIIKLFEEKKTCELSLNSTMKQMEASNRDLLVSQQNLTQLTKELENLESAKLEDEFKYNQIQQQFDSLKVEYELLKQKYDIQEAQFKDKDKQIETLKSFAYDQKEINFNSQTMITQVKNEMQTLEEKIWIQYENNEEQLKELDSAKNSIQLITDELAELLVDKAILEEKIANQTKTLKDREFEMNYLASSFKKQSDDLRKLENKCKDYEKTIGEQSTLIGPFREQLERLERYEIEQQMLLEHKNQAENEAKEMGLKYAEILGHQNHKQKVKHMIDLKKKNIDLAEQKQDFETKIQVQRRTIEKLQNKVAQLTNNKLKCSKETNKENVCNNNNSKNCTNSPAALKERR